MAEFLQVLYHQTMDYLQAGGAVMPPLVMVSLVMWLLIFKRAFFFRRLSRRNMPFRTAREHVQQGRLPDRRQYSGAIAPLLGLLGTVTGMIATFDIMSVFGTGNAKAMAGGISEALITTQTGLLVAIPGLYMKGFLDRRARNLQQRITAAGLFLRRHL
jgi:biopolymer transport protein ExbB